MLFGKQHQEVNVNELMAQMKDGYVAMAKMDAISKYLTKTIVQAHNDFVKDKENRDKEFYTFYYPFKLLTDDLERIAELIGYVVDPNMTSAIKEDLIYATEWNKTHGKEA